MFLPFQLAALTPEIPSSWILDKVLKKILSCPSQSHKYGSLKCFRERPCTASMKHSKCYRYIKCSTLTESAAILCSVLLFRIFPFSVVSKCSWLSFLFFRFLLSWWLMFRIAFAHKFQCWPFSFGYTIAYNIDDVVWVSLYPKYSIEKQHGWPHTESAHCWRPQSAEEHKYSPFQHPLSKTSTEGMRKGNRHLESAEQLLTVIFCLPWSSIWRRGHHDAWHCINVRKCSTEVI